MNEVEDVEQGQRLLSAVERLLADDEQIAGVVEEARLKAGVARGAGEAETALVAHEVIARYARATMISGGVTALPAVIPGAGTVVVLTGGVLADMALTLKYEVELTLALAHLHGFDIGDEAERRAALLLASVATYDAKSGGNFLVDMARAQGTAVWKYGPRQGSKLLLIVLSKLALAAAGKGLARAIPIVGVALGAGVNRVLTQRVGERVRVEMEERGRVAASERASASDGGPIVDAYVTGRGGEA